MRTVRSTIALLLAFLLAAALCGCAASPPGESPGSAPAKPVGATDFMSYAGPVFPLTLAQAEPALSADRELLLDCAPYAEENTAAITVADRYTIRNDSGEDCTVTVLYPFVSSLSDLDSLRPSLTADGAAARSTLYPGAFPGWFGPASAEPELAEERWNIRHAESWTEYQTLLTGSYQADALAPKTLPEQTVYVYSFTASGETTANAATLAITVDADPEKTTILTYGINGYGQNEATGQPQYSYFTRAHNQALHLLVVLGQDLTGCTMQGYTDGSCEQGKELDSLKGTVTRTEMPLAELLRQTATAQLGADASGDAAERLAAAAADLLTQYGVCSAAPAERYSDGMLDAVLQDAEVFQRVCYAAAEITIPAGGTVCVEAVSRKPHSFDFFGFYNEMVDGYGVMTTGSVLTLQNQTARLDTHGLVTIYGQNFEFDGQGSAVPLLADTEYYYLNLTAGFEPS